MTHIAKKNITMSEELFALILQISKDKRWLHSKSPALASVFSLCETDDEKTLIYDLLSRFTYVESDEFSNHIENILNYYSVYFSGKTANYIFAPLYNDDKDKRSDSSLAVLHALKAKRHRFPNLEYRDINSAFKAIHEYGVTDVILIDEFVGSGKQAMGVVESLQKKIALEGFHIKLHMGTVASMIKAKSKIEKTVESYFSSMVLRRGISDYNDFHRAKELKSLMKKIESRFDSPVIRMKQQRKLYHLGFQQTQALYKYANSTTANNVFPVFFWKELSDGTIIDNILDPY